MRCGLLWPICVRPYLVESTTSRPICEVKQPQASLVLRSVMTWEPGVSYATFCPPSKGENFAAAPFGNGRYHGALQRKLLTNAIKVTVSVLYWYEELSSSSGNFWERSSDLFFICFFFPGGGGLSRRPPKLQFFSWPPKPKHLFVSRPCHLIRNGNQKKDTVHTCMNQ